MSLTKVSYAMINLEPISVLDYGADATGTNDSTTAIQNAITASTAGQAVIFPPGTYKIVSNITVSKGIVISGYGAKINCVGNAALFYVSGTNIIGLKFQGITFYGDATTGNTPTGGAIQSPSGATTEDWVIEDCTFKDLSFGIAINSNTSGYHKRPVVRNCLFKNMVGTASGTGIGLNFAGGPTTAMQALAIGNIFDTIGRHSLYISSGLQLSVIGNTFKNQTSAIDRVASLAVARCSDVLVEGNTFYSNDVGVSVEPAESAVSAQGHADSLNISVIGNLFRDTTRYDIVLGSTDTAAGTKALRYAKVAENKILKSGANDYSSIYVLSGAHLMIENNYIDASLITVNYTLACVYLDAISSPGNTNDDYVVRNNILRCVGTAGGGITDTRGITIGTAVKSIRLIIQNNDITAITKIQGYTGLGIYNITSQGLSNLVGWNADNTATPNVYGAAFMRISNSSPTNVTNFLNGVEGQTLLLAFGNSNTTIKRSASILLVGGVDYVSAANQTLQLVYTNSVWSEVSRSAPA
jgi:hypothetical protein